MDPDSLEVFKGAVVEQALYDLAKKAILEARKESEERLKKAKQEGEEASPHAVLHCSEAEREDEPVANAEQLVGMENARFQGMRLAYFALDKESKLGCLDEGEGVQTGGRTGDRVVLNRIVSLKEDAGKIA